MSNLIPALYIVAVLDNTDLTIDQFRHIYTSPEGAADAIWNDRRSSHLEFLDDYDSTEQFEEVMCMMRVDIDSQVDTDLTPGNSMHVEIDSCTYVITRLEPQS